MDLKKASLIGLLSLTSLANPAVAASFILNDGMQFEGEVVQGTSNSVIIQTGGGSLIPLPYNKIATVRLEVDGGKAILGGLLSWNAGAYTLRVGERIVGVHNGRITSVVGSADDQPEEPVILDSGSSGSGGAVPAAEAPAHAPVAPSPPADDPAPSAGPTTRPQPTM
jgi:hypothetical protein